MRLILLGPPGCGKGTQAKLLTRHLGLEHVGTGDILRAAIRRNSLFGSKARSYVETGQLVPDELVNGLIEERFQMENRPDRFVMDGYPRTLAQAIAFDRVLRHYALPLTAVILLEVSD